MASNNRKNKIDPVYVMGAGVALVAVALIMLLFQSSGEIVPASVFAGSFGQISVAFITGFTTVG
jgi:hypothetical protein